ncbi:hypothetical protein A2U01_0071464, partial [Trifolium medium]|nr:hypothetical protein [Trifolium medium]
IDDEINEKVKVKVGPSWLVDTATVCIAVFTLVSACLGVLKLVIEIIEKCENRKPEQAAGAPARPAVPNPTASQAGPNTTARHKETVLRLKRLY